MCLSVCTVTNGGDAFSITTPAAVVTAETTFATVVTLPLQLGPVHNLTWVQLFRAPVIQFLLSPLASTISFKSLAVPTPPRELKPIVSAVTN